MPDYILTQETSGQWKRAAEQDLPDERVLQRLIREHPEILPLDDLGDDVPPLLIVGREVALLNGYVDVIAVDQDGLITLIECKLDRNPEVKRKVVGQILGYAAYLWGMTGEQFETGVARRYFDSPQCHDLALRGQSLEDAMAAFREQQATGGEWDRLAFREQLAANLRDGRLRLIIVVDKVNDELRRTVEFLNACTGPHFELLCAELRYYATASTRLLVPALIGKPGGLKPDPKPPVPGGSWTPDRFFSTLRERGGETAERAARRLLAWCDQAFEKTYWGTGARNGSFSGLIWWDKDHVANFFTAWTSGGVEIGFQYLKPYPPFDQAERRRALLGRLNAISGLALPEGAFDRRPSFPLTALANDEAFARFTEVLEAAVTELRAARDQFKRATETGPDAP